LVSLLHTDLSWDEMSLSKEHERTAVCDRELCSQRGLLQKVKPSRVLLGSLNPVDIGFFPLRLETFPTRWGRPFKRIMKFGGSGASSRSLPPLRPKRAAYGVACLRSGSDQRSATRSTDSTVGKRISSKPIPPQKPLSSKERELTNGILGIRDDSKQ
jgi:hypothetical protein